MTYRPLTRPVERTLGAGQLASGAMRIIAGSARGRRLVVPEGEIVRPTGDRVREAAFNSLYSAGAIEGVTVLDLFAGSGAMGLEALSRGADHVTFVDASPIAIDAVQTNVDALGFAERATVRRADAMTYVASSPAVDVAILDPPYPFDEWSTLLGQVPAEVVVVESDREIELGPRWESFKCGRYAATVVELARAVRSD